MEEALSVPRRRERVVASVEAKPVDDVEVPSATVEVVEAVVNAAPAATVEVTKAEVKAEPDYLGKIEGIDARLKVIGDKITPVELKEIENKLTLTLAELSKVNGNLESVDKRLQTLLGWALVFGVASAAGIVILILYLLRQFRVL